LGSIYLASRIRTLSIQTILLFIKKNRIMDIFLKINLHLDKLKTPRWKVESSFILKFNNIKWN
jgi:hypothetical protein